MSTAFPFFFIIICHLHVSVVLASFTLLVGTIIDERPRTHGAPAVMWPLSLLNSRLMETVHDRSPLIVVTLQQAYHEQRLALSIIEEVASS